MRVPRSLAIVLGVLTVATAVAFPSRVHTPSAIAQALAGPRPVSLSDIDASSVVPGRVSLTFAHGADPAATEAAIAASGAALHIKVPEIGLYDVALPDGWTVAQGIARLVRLSGVVAAEPVAKGKPTFIPNDPLYGSYQEGYLESMHAEEAWDMQQGDPSVVVAVVDSGIDINHPDLAQNIWTNPNPGHGGCGNDIHGCYFPDDSGDSCPAVSATPNSDISPVFFHGTFVAGVIAAANNNDIGVTGIAPHVKIMPVKVATCGNGGITATTISEGVLYAAHNGARVMNISIGLDYTDASPCVVIPLGIYNAFVEAQRLGMLATAAAGNNNQPCLAEPANSPGVLAVSATGPGGQGRATFTNYGPEITVSAPGVSIVSTTWGPDIPGIRRGSGNLMPPYDVYARYDGTSFAAPMVAGLAALLISQNSLLTPDMVRGLIQRGATPMPPADVGVWAGAGRIDLAESLRRVPGAYQGHVFLDRSVPDGTSIDAKVGDQLCGHTVTSTLQGQAAYALFVAAAADVPGCGTPGGQVSFSVGGTVVATVSFKQAVNQLDLGRSSAAAPASSSGAVLYHSGWNIVAGPAGSTFAAASGALYTLQPSDSTYESIATTDAAKAGFGYWAYFPRDTTVPLAADGTQTYSIRLPAGQFVLIGNPSGSRVVTVTGADSVLVYDPVSGTYKDTVTLQPGQGAWAVSNAGGTVTLQ